MNVLIISANSLAASPTGPAYIAGAAQRAGHTVEVLECLFSSDIEADIATRIAHFQPDVVGISIRLVHGYIIDAAAPYNTRHLDLRKNVKQVVDARQAGQLADERLLFEGANYLSPELPKPFMEEPIGTLRTRQGFTVQVNQPHAGYRWES